MRLPRIMIATLCVCCLLGGLQAETKKLTNADVVKMASNGFDDDTIIKAIAANETAFDTSLDGLMALKTAGVSKPVMDAMLTASQPKAALPQSDSASSGLPDDVGVFARIKGKLVEVEPEVVGWRTGGFMKSMATGGLTKGHTNGQIRGKQSPLRMTTPVEFVIRCPEGTSVTEYQLLRLDEKGDRREFRSVTGGIVHASGGTEKNAVKYDFEKIAPRIYTVKLADIKKGEYGFLPPGAMSASMGSAGKIYSFGVIE